MEDNKNNSSFKFFIYLSLFWIIIAWGGYLLALAGFFYWWSISLLIAVVFAGGIRFIISSLIKASPTFIVFNLIFIASSIIFVYYSSPTVFSGRDQASISQAAIRLSQNGKIGFSNSVSEDFFKINNIQKDKTKNCLIDNLNDFQDTNYLELKIYQTYCQAVTSTKAFNFPGFYYTNEGLLVTQFPIVYIAWLAIFYSFLGLWGFPVANGLLLYLFFISFYLLITKLTDRKNSSSKEKLVTQIFGMTILLSSFCFMWFSKFTLTENMATPLLWTGILATVLFISPLNKNQTKKNIELLLVSLSLGLLIFTRIEGLAFFFLALMVLLANKNSRKYIKKNLIHLIIPLLIFISVVFVWNFVVDIYLYKSILRATLENIKENATDINRNNGLLSILTLFKILGLYGLLTPIILGLGGVFYSIKQKNYTQLIPLAIAFPALFYLISPQITPEHPWMLRRFVFAVLPLFILYSIILINNFTKKKNIIWGILITIIILFFNLRPFINYLNFVPNKDLLKDTRELSQSFSNKDLVLVDQLASGDKYEMIADPLNSIFNKNAVYFFNYQDLDKIDLSKYEKTYLIIPESKVEHYQRTPLISKMLFIKNYELHSSALLSNNKTDLPQKEAFVTRGSIYEIIK